MTRLAATHPTLYSPYGLMALTLLFTPILGGQLAGHNWAALGLPTKARQARRWVRLTLLVIALYFVARVVFPQEPLMQWAGPYLLLVLWAGWMITTGVPLARAMKAASLTGPYQSLSRATLIGGLGWVLFTMVSTSVTLFTEITGVGMTAPTSDAVIIRRDESGVTHVEAVPSKTAEK